MAKGAGKNAKRAVRLAELEAEAGGPARLAAVADAVGAKKIKGKCCRSTPRCKGCPVVLMRTARLAEAGLTGKDLKKAMKKARAA